MAAEIIMPLPLDTPYDASGYDNNGLPSGLPIAQPRIDVYRGNAPETNNNTETPLTSQDLIAPALDMSALAGTGGLAGVGEGAGAATLGTGPFLRPALKYEGKIYKAPMGGEHMDAVPPSLRNEFTKQA